MVAFSVRGKRHGWDPLACLASARQLLGFLLQSLETHPSTAAFHAALDTTLAHPSGQPAGSSAVTLPPDAPVYRVAFAAGGPDSPGVSVRQLSQAEVEEEVLGDKQEAVGGGRVGFLLEQWVRKRAQARAARIQGGEGGRGQERVCAPPAKTPASTFVLQR